MAKKRVKSKTAPKKKAVRKSKKSPQAGSSQSSGIAQVSPSAVGQANLDVQKLWEKYEDVAMHFNDLIIRIRMQALGGLAAIAVVSGLVIRTGQTTESLWWIVTGTLSFLAFAWVAVACIDLLYYRRLLLGAVAALLVMEEQTNGQIQLSTTIDKQFVDPESCCAKFRRLIPGLLFYGIVLAGLVIGARCASLAADKEAQRHLPGQPSAAASPSNGPTVSSPSDSQQVTSTEEDEPAVAPVP